MYADVSKVSVIGGLPDGDKSEQDITASRTPDEGTGPVSLFRFPHPAVFPKALHMTAGGCFSNVR